MRETSGDGWSARAETRRRAVGWDRDGAAGKGKKREREIFLIM